MPDSRFYLEKRQHPRRPFTLSIGLTCGRFTSHNRARDISLSGIFVENPEEISPGREVQVSIPFSHRNRHIRMKGRVARTTPDGIGVEFDVYSIEFGESPA